MAKKFFTFPIKAYQKLSRLTPPSCRYYPTCSEYAIWRFEFESPLKALFNSTLRVLRCNQLFEGGIDYPKISYSPPKKMELFNNLLHSKEILHLVDKKKPSFRKFVVKYWLVPKNGKFLIVKDFDGTRFDIR